MTTSVRRTLTIILSCLLIIQSGCLRRPHTGHENPVIDFAEEVSGTVTYDRAVGASPRRIPVAYDVDVVVVGGSSGAVAAAVAAAQKGAKVFLAAQRPYLGEDLCGTYRLWLEEHEVPDSPFTRKLFTGPPRVSQIRKGVRFTYQADKPSADIHKDTPQPSILTDGKYGSAATQSVQYDGDVTITADLKAERDLRNVHIMLYQRCNPGAGDNFEVDSVAISVSGDARQWRDVATIKNDRVGEALSEPWGPIHLSTALEAKARYVRFSVRKSPDAARVLLGEIVIQDENSLAEPAARPARTPPTPMHVKRTLDQALLEAGVHFLYGCYVTDVLTDENGNSAGIVMANRSGRQAVRAKAVIDATPRAAVARLAGAAFRPYPPGPRVFKWVTIGGRIQPADDIEARTVPAPAPDYRVSADQFTEYTLKIPMKDASFASFAQAEQIIRDKTWRADQLDSSETPFQIPPDLVKAKKSLAGRWPGAGKVNLDVFRPAGMDRLYVLGGCADVTRTAAEKLLRPLELIKAGERIGAAAASSARRTPALPNVRLPARLVPSAAPGDVMENLAGIRTAQADLGTVPVAKHSLPVFGEYDVVVVGGGTGGAPAGISAARRGAKTLVLEYLHGLGGVGTMGFISKYYYGYIEGFTKEIDQGVAELSPGKKNTSPAWDPRYKSEWYRRELRKAGADIWFGVLGCGAFVENGRINGVVVATPHGRGVVLAKTVVDSTGNADIAAAAGGECVYTDASSVAVQGTGLPPRKMGAGYTNTDWTFVDDSDVIDVWRTFVVAKTKYKDAYDLGQLVDTRERRRIVGDFTISPMDISTDRTYPDTIAIARSNFDTHGFTIHPLFMTRPPDREAMLVNVPYRCLLPKGLDRILVTGLGVSAHRDAMPVIRMQADIQNQGYAAGLIAAAVAETGQPLRDVDIKAVQKQLVEKGNVPETVLTDYDSFPLSLEKVIKAVETVTDNYKGLEIILAQQADAMPLLQQAYSATADPNAKLIYAHILGMLGDPTGADTLLDAVSSAEWDKGWNFTGMGQFGMSLSPLDSLIIALARTNDKRALAPILKMAGGLDAASEFSHIRAVAVALETLADNSAAQSLADLLNKPGMTGHAFTDITKAQEGTPNSGTDTSTRNASLKELFLARALYRCGDYEGLGERILKDYARDLRAHYARHAQAILKGLPAKGDKTQD